MKSLSPTQRALLSVGGSLSATSNPKYQPKVLGLGYENIDMKKPTKSQTRSIYDPYPIKILYGNRASTFKDALKSAKRRLEQSGHKIWFESIKDNKNHNVGKCKHCGMSAGILFIPFAGEFVLVGKAFDRSCSHKPKKNDTVSKYPLVITTPISYYNTTSKGFNVDLTNYPFGIVREGGQDDIWK